MKRQIISELDDKPKLKSELALNAFIRAVDRVHAEDAKIAAEEKAQAETAGEFEKSADEHGAKS